MVFYLLVHAVLFSVAHADGKAESADKILSPFKEVVTDARNEFLFRVAAGNAGQPVATVSAADLEAFLGLLRRSMGVAEEASHAKMPLSDMHPYETLLAEKANGRLVGVKRGEDGTRKSLLLGRVGREARPDAEIAEELAGIYAGGSGEGMTRAQFRTMLAESFHQDHLSDLIMLSLQGALWVADALHGMKYSSRQAWKSVLSFGDGWF